MNEKSCDRVQFGLGGDTTNGPISLSDMTSINPGLRELLRLSVKPDEGLPSSSSPSPVPQQQQQQQQQQQIHPAAHPTFEIDQSSILPNPEEIQIRMTHSQPLASSQKTIEFYKAEILKYKMQLYQMQQSSAKDIENFNLDEVKQDLVADLKNKNRLLEKQLEERDKKEERKKSRLKNSECQTNLYNSHIDELLRDRITLRDMMKQPLLTNEASTQTHQQQHQPQQQPQQQYDYNQQQQSHHHHHQQPHYSNQLPQNQFQYHQQHQHHQYHQQPQPTPAQPLDNEPRQIMSQLHYPSVTITKQIASNKQLTSDEKEILETLFRVNGCMTTTLDKLKAVSDRH